MKRLVVLTSAAACLLGIACGNVEDAHDRNIGSGGSSAAGSGGAAAISGSGGQDAQSNVTSECLAVGDTCVEEPNLDDGFECCAINGRVFDEERGCAATTLMTCERRADIECGGDSGIGCYSRNLADGGVELYQTSSTHEESRAYLASLGFEWCDEATYGEVGQWEFCSP